MQVSKVREDKSVSQSVKGGQCNYGYEAAEPYKRKWCDQLMWWCVHDIYSSQTFI